MTFAAIGAHLGVTWQAAQQAVNRSLDATKAAIAERADELRAVEAERLERITEILWPRVLEGDLRAIDRVLRARESFRRLTGLDLTPETTDAGSAATYVLTSGDVSLVPPGVPWIDTRLPSERPELLAPARRHPRRVGVRGRLMTLAPIMRVEEVMVRYGIRDARTARRLMNTVGAFKVGGRLVVREDTLGAWEVTETNPAAPRRRGHVAPPGRAQGRQAHQARPSPASGPDWWRPAIDAAPASSRSLNARPGRVVPWSHQSSGAARLHPPTP